tara:strand:+ start:413 stop:574 length:162 start_codon:yes stop_codon:yes gene_type:complete
MTEIRNIDSILEVKASGSIDVSDDLNKPEGKAIAELLHEQQEDNQTPKDDDAS